MYVLYIARDEREIQQILENKGNTLDSCLHDFYQKSVTSRQIVSLSDAKSHLKDANLAFLFRTSPVFKNPTEYGKIIKAAKKYKIPLIGITKERRNFPYGNKGLVEILTYEAYDSKDPFWSKVDLYEILNDIKKTKA